MNLPSKRYVLIVHADLNVCPGAYDDDDNNNNNTDNNIRVTFDINVILFLYLSFFLYDVNVYIRIIEWLAVVSLVPCILR